MYVDIIVQQYIIELLTWEGHVVLRNENPPLRVLVGIWDRDAADQCSVLLGGRIIIRLSVNLLARKELPYELLEHETEPISLQEAIEHHKRGCKNSRAQADLFLYYMKVGWDPFRQNKWLWCNSYCSKCQEEEQRGDCYFIARAWISWGQEQLSQVHENGTKFIELHKRRQPLTYSCLGSKYPSCGSTQMMTDVGRSQQFRPQVQKVGEQITHKNSFIEHGPHASDSIVNPKGCVLTHNCFFQ